MFNFLKLKEVDIYFKNLQGKTGLKILEKRAMDKNPYDNLHSVRLFYHHVVSVMPKEEKLKGEKTDFMWRSSENMKSTYPSSRPSKTSRNSIPKKS